MPMPILIQAPAVIFSKSLLLFLLEAYLQLNCFGKKLKGFFIRKMSKKKKLQSKNELKRQLSSFRDPSGYLFYKDGRLYRCVNKAYKENYNYLKSSGLYNSLVADKLIISHKEVNIKKMGVNKAFKVIKPELIPFISYPYEWCFTQLKKAALLTLEIQKKALKFNMFLKDCSAYNVQFIGPHPIFIDTLSFEKYQEGQLWPAYRQFCEQFLAPLALMSYKDVRLNKLSQLYIDGVSLDLASKLLPLKSMFNVSLLAHIYLHSKSQGYFSNKPIAFKRKRMSRHSFIGLVESLRSVIEKLKWKIKKSEWGNYYDETNYSKKAFISKKKLVNRFLGLINPNIVWDLGSNRGLFTKISTAKGFLTISLDSDPVSVEKNYTQALKDNDINCLPLLVDLANPSPGIGWNNKERKSLIDRGPADAVLALALIHHLRISNSLPLYKIAEFFNKICSDSLIIEFVPKVDSKVQKLLLTRKDIFSDYKKNIFEKEFKKHFLIRKSEKIKGSSRVLYFMQKKSY